MNSSKYRFTLDMHSHQSQISIPALLKDSSRSLYISFTDGGNPYFIEDGCLAEISIKRPDGTFLVEPCTIANHTTVVYDFEQNTNTCAMDGIHDCDVILYDAEGGRITSPRFTMVVSDRVVRKDDINITTEDKTTIDNIRQVEAARVLAEIARQDNEAKRVEAETAREATHTAIVTKLNNGEFNGKDGADGKDGVSPTIKITDITGGHRVSITDAVGTKSFDVMDGDSPIASTITNIKVFASAWQGTESPYSQVVTIAGVTAYTKVDLLPSVEQLAIFHNKDLAFVTENEDGIVTVYAIGDKPKNDYTIQASLTEVKV